MPDRFCEFELSVGDVLQIGDRIVTVIDIDGSEVSFRIDVEDVNELASDSVLRASIPGK